MLKSLSCLEMLLLPFMSVNYLIKWMQQGCPQFYAIMVPTFFTVYRRNNLSEYSVFVIFMSKFLIYKLESLMYLFHDYEDIVSRNMLKLCAMHFIIVLRKSSLKNVQVLYIEIFLHSIIILLSVRVNRMCLLFFRTIQVTFLHNYFGLNIGGALFYFFRTVHNL